MIDLSIIIVNYNVRHYLAQCLESVARASQDIEVETVVVDNASSDGSQEYIKRLFPEIRYIYNENNEGFARANNKGIKATSGKYVLLLNPDTILSEDSLRRCVSFLDATPTAGATGVMMLKSDGDFAKESRRGIPTPFVAFCKMSGLCSHFPKNRRLGKYYMGYLDKEQPSEIEIISGACMMIRREALNKSGLLDEDFFMYGEDIDLSYRLLKNGYSNHYLPVPILHYKGESTQKSSYRYVYNFYNAMLIFFKKHYSNYSMLLSIPIKSAIVVKAVWAYMVQQLTKGRNHKKENEGYMESKSYLLVGGKEHIDGMMSIMKLNNISATTLVTEVKPSESTEKRIENIKKAIDGKVYDYIVFDTDAYSYTDILMFFKQQEKRHSKIGTYYPRMNAIITDHKVFEG